MDKASKEALQVVKEITCKFIETRAVSPGNFAEVFPVIYRVVAQTIAERSSLMNLDLKIDKSISEEAEAGDLAEPLT